MTKCVQYDSICCFFFLKHFLMCKSDFWKEVPVEIIWSMGRDVNEAILSWWEDISIIYAKYKLLNVLHQALYAKTTIKENFLIVERKVVEDGSEKVMCLSDYSLGAEIMDLCWYPLITFLSYWFQLIWPKYGLVIKFIWFLSYSGSSST